MAQRNSFATVTQQITNYNTNVTNLLAALNTISTTSNDTVAIRTTDQFGVISETNVQSIGFLKSEIDRLNNNINTLFAIDDAGATVQTANNKFRKVVTIDLNKDPSQLADLEVTTSFGIKSNHFFDALLNPQLLTSFNLTGKIDDDVRKVLIRRYIVDFNKDEDGNLTTSGQAAANSFNELFRNQNNIVLEDLIIWHSTTAGVVSGLDPLVDEQKFDLEPNSMLYDGTFNVIRVEEDTLNRKLWYHLNTLDYLITETGEVRQLTVDDEVIVNEAQASTRYKVIEISTADTNPRVRFERIEGLQPIPVLVGALKIYSPVVTNQEVRISIGYDERNVVFMKPLNSNEILAKNWSLGTGYYTNDLTLSSETNENGTNLEQFYIDRVFDYGKVLDDLVAKKIPSSLAGAPAVPDLDDTNFKVVQINKHLTDNPDTKLLKTKSNEQKNIKSEITQIAEALSNKEKQKRVTRFSSKAAKRQFENEISNLQQRKVSKSKLLQSTVREIIDLSTVSASAIGTTPKFRVRGFWNMPEATIVRGSRPQEVIQFKIMYQYISKSGQAPPTETFPVTSPADGSNTKAAYSNWTTIVTDVRQRTQDPTTGEFIWNIEDVADADTPNINQLDIAINVNEKVEIKIISISEVGWPESPAESSESETITIEFPDDLNNVLGDNEFVLKEAEAEELRVSFQEDLTTLGLEEHVQSQTTLNDEFFAHPSDELLSGYLDSNGVAMNLKRYLDLLTDKIQDLEERVTRIKGELRITVFRNNDEFVVKNNSELVFNVDCEDFADEFTGDGIPTGRVYANNIYVIKEFLLKIENVAQSSPLGLLSGRTYFVDSDFTNITAPQAFWVSEQDNLLFTTESGNTRTQLDNQYLFMANYLNVDDSNVVKITEDIGSTLTNNSLTEILGSSEFNLGVGTNVLEFVNNNNSVLDVEKWVDTTTSVESTRKLLSSIHPVTESLEKIVENNEDKVKVVDPGDENATIVPLNIYFKFNALDPNAGEGKDFDYVDFNKSLRGVKHTKQVKFFLENESENRPFQFTIKFNLNRNKLVLPKISSVRFSKFIR